MAAARDQGRGSSRGILEAIDMDRYRVEVKTSLKIGLPDEDAEVGPVSASGGGRKAGTGAGPTEQHHPGVQRPVRQHRLEGWRQDPQGYC